MTNRERGLAVQGPWAPVLRLMFWFCCLCLDEFWFSDGSLSDKSKCTDPSLMPLPDTATGLDWSHLVDAARAFEGKDVIATGLCHLSKGSCDLWAFAATSWNTSVSLPSSYKFWAALPIYKGENKQGRLNCS